MPFPGVGEGFASENGATEVELSPEEVALEELRVDLDDPWTLAQAFVISVGITPVVEEFFFRGVLQQSLVARLGLARGIGFVALLYTLPHLPAVATLPRFLAGIVSAFGIGCLLGLVRVATGSILASIILASLTAGVGILSFAVRENLPLPGMNVEGTHLPITVTIASIVVVAWAAHAVYEEATKKFEAELLREK
jgi:membrane protease YdiL (CAAX protease family)